MNEFTTEQLQQLIYDGIQAVAPVDLMETDRFNRYASLWASSAQKKIAEAIANQPAGPRTPVRIVLPETDSMLNLRLTEIASILTDTGGALIVAEQFGIYSAALSRDGKPDLTATADTLVEAITPIHDQVISE